MKVRCVVILRELMGHAMKITVGLNVGLHAKWPLLFSKFLALLCVP